MGLFCDCITLDGDKVIQKMKRLQHHEDPICAACRTACLVIHCIEQFQVQSPHCVPSAYQSVSTLCYTLWNFGSSCVYLHPPYNTHISDDRWRDNDYGH